MFHHNSELFTLVVLLAVPQLFKISNLIIGLLWLMIADSLPRRTTCVVTNNFAAIKSDDENLAKIFLDAQFKSVRGASVESESKFL